MKASLIRKFVTSFGLMLMLAGMAGTASAFDAPSAPELDPGSMAGALTVVSGALFILRGRRAGK